MKRSHPDCPQMSRAETLTLSGLLLLPAVLMCAAANAAGVAPFTDAQAWFTYVASGAVAAVIVLYRPGCVAGMWRFCAATLSVNGAAGWLLWAFFPDDGYDITLNLGLIAFCAMAFPILLSVQHQY